MRYCANCEGFGEFQMPEMDVYGNVIWIKHVDCKECYGTGEVPNEEVVEFWKDQHEDFAA